MRDLSLLVCVILQWTFYKLLRSDSDVLVLWCFQYYRPC